MVARRVTFVLPIFVQVPIGGYLVVYEYANYLARHGWEVTIVFPRWKEVMQRMPVSLKGRLWPLKARALNRPLIPWFELDERIRIKLVVQWSADNIPNADFIFATAYETAGPVAALPSSKGRKFYLVQHFETWAGTEDDINATFRMPFSIVVISPWLEEIVRRAGAQSVVHISNGLNHDDFRELSVERDPRSILTLYHTEPLKGVPDALEAIKHIHAEHTDVKVTMFGVPERGAEIPDWVTYVRNPPRETLIQLYNKVSIYVSASLAEGWALPPAEAMACGALFVGTDSGGCRDYAESEVTALLSAPGDPSALYHNLQRALMNGPTIDAIRLRGTEHIRSFTWDASGKKLIAEMDKAHG